MTERGPRSYEMTAADNTGIGRFEQISNRERISSPPKKEWPTKWSPDSTTVWINSSAAASKAGLISPAVSGKDRLARRDRSSGAMPGRRIPRIEALEDPRLGSCAAVAGLARRAEGL